MAQSSYQLIVLVEDLVLTWPSSFNGNPVINDINDIEAVSTGFSITLPDATLVSPGQNFIVNNVSSNSFDILLNDGTTLLTPDGVAAGQVIEIYLTSTSTSNGSWRVISPSGSFNGIVELTAQSTDNSIVVTGGNVTPPSGVINFALPTSITNLNKLATTDFLVVTNTAPLTFNTVELVGGENITITNGNGLGGDVIIDLNTVITSLDSLTVGNMTMTGDLITNNLVNGNIQLNTNGTGQIQLNGVNIDANGNISGVGNFISAAAYCVFTDTIVGTSNQIVIQQQANISSVTGSGGTYMIHFTSPMNTFNYGVFITLGSTGGSLPFISNAYNIVKTTTSVTIIVTDASGELVLSAPHGVSVMIMSI
jgi:hypothetical protein